MWGDDAVSEPIHPTSNHCTCPPPRETERGQCVECGRTVVDYRPPPTPKSSPLHEVLYRARRQLRRYSSIDPMAEEIDAVLSANESVVETTAMPATKFTGQREDPCTLCGFNAWSHSCPPTNNGPLGERRPSVVETSLNEPATLELLRVLHDQGTGGAPIERLKELCRVVGCTKHWQDDNAQKASAHQGDV